jgi:hypothetical protein
LLSGRAGAQYQDLSIIIFVHGWKHNDAPSDTADTKPGPPGVGPPRSTLFSSGVPAAAATLVYGRNSSPSAH